ncbi:MAG TPA: hypothetical protein VHM90_00190, partial [Phycisphaerae bacterium]|nr:hypothetical protein [Phycisphaerae bacterium]
LDDNGAPVAGANIHLVGGGHAMRDFRTIAKTDADGMYHVLVEPNMYYALIAEKGRMVSDIRHQVIFTNSDEPMNFRLYEGRHVHGRVTAGPDRKPVPDHEVDLVYNDESYYSLPKDAPHLPEIDNHAISPSIRFSTRTNKEGAYDYYLPPGAYDALTYFTGEEVSSRFELNQPGEMEVNLYSKAAADMPRERTGRVVRADKPEEAVAEASLMGHFVDSSIPVRAPEAVADKAGVFKMRAVPYDFNLATLSPDRKWGDYRLVHSDEDQVVIKLSPTASASGRLVDDAGRPLAGQTILWAHPVPEGNGMTMITYWNVLGGRTRTDAAGRFAATGLLVGWDYEITLGNDDPAGEPLRNSKLAVLTPANAEEQRLGDVRVPAAATGQGRRGR